MHLASNSIRFANCSILLLITAICALAQTSFAAEPDYTEEDHILVGLDLVYESGLYHGQDGYIYPDFQLDIRQGDLFAKGQTIGYDMFVGERASLSIAITRDDTFLEVDSISDEQTILFYGIEDRKRAIEAGLIYKYKSRVGVLSFEYFKDFFSNAHEGLRTLTRITRPIPNNSGLVIEPSLFVEYHSKEFNTYYYQVTEKENRVGARKVYGVVNDTTLQQYRKDYRGIYEPGNSAHWGLDINLRMPLANQLSLTGYLAFKDITGPVFRSPLIEDRKFYQAKLGLAYTF